MLDMSWLTLETGSAIGAMIGAFAVAVGIAGRGRSEQSGTSASTTAVHQELVRPATECDQRIASGVEDLAKSSGKIADSAHTVATSAGLVAERMDRIERLAALIADRLHRG